jgi:tight adherence protein B
VNVREGFFAVATVHVGHFFTSLDHRISPLGLLAVALAVAAVLLYVVLWLASRYRRPSLANMLAPYRLTTPVEGGAGQPAPMLTMPLLTRLASRVQTPATGTRLGRWLDGLLERAGSRIRVGELLTIWGTAGVILILIGWLLAGFVGLLIVLILSLVIPVAVLQVVVDRRAKLFGSQLPDVLKLTSSSLRAGFSLLQGLESVTRQVREPSKGELQRVLAEARLGRPLEDALESAADRIRNRDFTESVVAVRIQQESGGNLAVLFDTLAETMVQRVRMRREVRSLTAEGRLSAYILGILPLALAIFIFVVDRAYMMVLFHTFAGKVMLVGGIVLELVGFVWMWRTVKIDA